MKKEIYIFGAGASKAAVGTPLGNDLGWSYYGRCSTLYRMENGRVAPDDLVEKREEFKTFVKFLEIAGKIYPELSVEKDKFIKDQESGLIYYPLFADDKKYFADEMLAIAIKNNDKDAIYIIKKVIYEHLVESSRYHSNDTLYDDFLKLSIGRNILIISFNFDTLIKEHYDNNVSIDYRIEFDGYNGNRGYKKFANCFDVLKLHGSCDWAWCSNCERIDLLGHWVSATSYENSKCLKCNSNLSPLMVVPHEQHMSYGHKYDHIWDIARQTLSKAEVINFIGYSLPDYDINVINLFKEAINPNAFINIYDPSADTCRIKLVKYKIGNIKNIHTENIGFKEYIEKIRKKRKTRG